MEAILQGIESLEGVLGSVVMGAAGQVLAYRAARVYDLPMIERLAAASATALESLQLAQEDWDAIVATFSDGKLLFRNLGGSSGDATSARALVVIADARLNISFAGVAIRVAVAKLKAAAASGALNASSTALGASSPRLAGSAVGSAPFQPAPGPNVMPALNASPVLNHSDLASTGLSWSGVSGGSSMAASGVAVSDPASAAFLTTCTKALARHVGPMSKAFVKEAVRKLWPGRAFSLELGPELLTELERHIEAPEERNAFKKSVK